MEKENSGYENWNGSTMSINPRYLSISTIMEGKLNNRCVTAIIIWKKGKGNHHMGTASE